MKERKKVIAIATGGTGGHIFPSVSLYDYLSKEYKIEFIINKNETTFFKSISFFVLKAGFEPTRELFSLPPQDSVYTSSTTSAKLLKWIFFSFFKLNRHINYRLNIFKLISIKNGITCRCWYIQWTWCWNNI